MFRATTEGSDDRIVEGGFHCVEAAAESLDGGAESFDGGADSFDGTWLREVEPC